MRSHGHVDRIKILKTQIFSEKVEEMKQHTAHRSARNNSPQDFEHPSGVEIEEEREDKEPLSRRSFQRIRRNITKTDSIWSRKIMRGPHSKRNGG
jgi:hypothetical protein